MDSEKTILVNGIEATVIRKRVRNVRVTIVPPDGAVRVTAPRLYPEVMIRLFLSEKADWIRAHSEQVRRRHADEPKRFIDGEPIRLFGSVYRLCVRQHTKNGAAPDGDCIVLFVKGDTTPEKREAILNGFLREMLKTEIAHLLPLWSERTGLIPSEWTIRSMTSRWGSCNTRTGKITLNLQLVHYPPICLEYVILHELAHLKVHGHGADFKAILDRYMPDWKTRKKLLNS